MKIEQHPRIANICVGDEVYHYARHVFARVVDVFPAAVCVQVAVLSLEQQVDIRVLPQLWCADDILNLSICRYCSAREQLALEYETGIPFRVCQHCCGLPPEVPYQSPGVWW